MRTARVSVHVEFDECWGEHCQEFKWAEALFYNSVSDVKNLCANYIVCLSIVSWHVMIMIPYTTL